MEQVIGSMTLRRVNYTNPLHHVSADAKPNRDDRGTTILPGPRELLRRNSRDLER